MITVSKSFGIEIRGFATASTFLEDVGDMRDLVKWLDEHGVDDSIGLDFDAKRVWVELADGEGDMILCGDHLVGEDKSDVILLTHKHVDAKDNPDVEVIPQYDWATRDKYLADWKGSPE